MPKLSANSLKPHIDLNNFAIEKVAAKHTDTLLGQERAQSALEFGIAMDAPGYNIFVMGEPGTGRLSMIMDHLNRHSASQETPPAYAYTDNFTNAREPVAIELPAGRGQTFKQDIDKLIDSLLATFPEAFESPSYQQKKGAIERKFNQRYNTAIDRVETKAQNFEIALFRDSDAITFAPIRNMKTLNEEQFTQLPQQQRDLFHKQVEKLEEYLAEVLLELPQWRRQMVEQIRKLDHQTVAQAIEPLFNDLNEKYQNIDDVITYLAEIKKDLKQTILDFLLPTRVFEAQENTRASKRLLFSEKYSPNILVDYTAPSGAPVIYDPHPTYQNLFGRIEYASDQGTLITSYKRICPGSLHRANGGFLVLDAEKVLTYPYVWDSLKRALQSARIEVETPYSEFGINTITLKPEVIPLNLKVILFGSREIFYLLQEMDSEFYEMFRVLADFDDHINLQADTLTQFAALMVRHTIDTGAKPLTTSALERLIEHSCRLAEDQQKLSAHINDALEIVIEANHLCKQAKTNIIDKEHIEWALQARQQRNGRISQTILEEMLDGTILIDTDGTAIGKINGLTVLEVGSSNFGAPARITVTVSPGSRGIVDIEREAELGQAIHTKGVMILTGYLSHCYTQQFPLAISANIAIEQSYGHIDGDSASLAELCCLISSLTQIPIKQSFAVTGSINQYGEVQAVGGVNEKIEGFFRLCQARPKVSTGHAVIIPAANSRNLMLQQDVIAAVERGEFSIYTVASVNETLELLTGMQAGQKNTKGEYPENSINAKAIFRLKEISEMAIDKDEEREDNPEC